MAELNRWRMPEWMHQAKHLITWQGSEQRWVEYVEEMYNDKTSVIVNAPRALIACSLKAEVDLLIRIHKDSEDGTQSPKN